MSEDRSDALLEHARWICSDYIGRIESANQRIALTLGIAVTLGTVVVAIGTSNATGWLTCSYLLAGAVFSVPALLAFRALQPVDGNDVSHEEIARVQKHIAEWPDANVAGALLNTLARQPRGVTEHPSVVVRLSDLKDRKFEQHQGVVRALLGAALACCVILGQSYALLGIPG